MQLTGNVALMLIFTGFVVASLKNIAQEMLRRRKLRKTETKKLSNQEVREINAAAGGLIIRHRMQITCGTQTHVIVFDAATLSMLIDAMAKRILDNTLCFACAGKSLWGLAKSEHKTPEWACEQFHLLRQKVLELSMQGQE